jgi:hypothetical protein
VLTRRIAEPGAKIALVGAGGSGKSTLAAAVGHRAAPRFPGGIQWFRVGCWDRRTLVQMIAMRLGLPARADLRALSTALARRPKTLFVLDNHEDDVAVAEILDGTRVGANAWLITARRCLIAGVGVFPVAAPMVASGESPFPRVAALTRMLRWNPLALELADAFVASGAITAPDLRQHLVDRGIDRVRALEHEDDLPEVALLVGWALKELSPVARRMLAVLAHAGGDHVDEASLSTLARAGTGGAPALAALRRFRLVQEPLAGRLALHATVRHVLGKQIRFDPRRLFKHYVALIRKHPERFEVEQTHLFAAMDFAHERGDLQASLAVDALVASLELDGDAR